MIWKTKCPICGKVVGYNESLKYKWINLFSKNQCKHLLRQPFFINLDSKPVLEIWFDKKTMDEKMKDAVNCLNHLGYDNKPHQIRKTDATIVIRINGVGNLSYLIKHNLT